MIHKVFAKNLVFFLSIPLLCLTSCKSCSDDRSRATPRTVFINLNQLPAKQKALSDYLKDVYIIPLETRDDILLDGLGVIDQDKSGIFCVSGEKETIYHFSREGNYLNSFSHNGKGPGEYLRIRTLRILPGTETLLVSDPRLQKIFQYTFAGELVKEIRLPPSTARFEVVQNGNIALHAGRFFNPGNENLSLNELIIIDPKGNVVQTYFPYEKPLMFDFGNAFTRPDADGHFYYSKQFDFNLYRINTDGEPEVYLTLDYGSHMASINELNGNTIEDLMSLVKEGKRSAIDEMVNTSDHLLLKNQKDRKSSMLVINKKSLELSAFGTDSLFTAGNYYGFPIRLPRDSYQDHFFFVMQAIDVQEVLSALSEDQKQLLRKKVRGFNQIVNIGIEDNPVLVYYRFKD